MAHPYESHREDKVSDRRVSHLTKGYASGSAVRDPDAAADRRAVARAVHKHEENMHKGEPVTRLASGGMSRHRPDHRAKGGRVKSKGTNVTVVVAPQGGQQGATPVPIPVPAAGPPPRPPMPSAGAPAPGMAPAAGMMPPGAPPGMPMRKDGGRVGRAYEEGVRNGTQVSHRTKNDLDKINTSPPLLTRARGGPIEAGNERGPKMHAGADSGEGRLERAALQKRSRLP